MQHKIEPPRLLRFSLLLLVLCVGYGAADSLASESVEKKTAPPRHGHPLPGIHGTTLDGDSFNLSNCSGKRTFFFDPAGSRAVR